MTNILVRDVPEDVHAALQHKAEQRHQSLQQYLAAELRKLAARREIGELFDEIDQRRGGSVGLRQAVADLESVRA